MNTFTLKMTALILMVLDHIGCYFDGAPVWLNWLGRLSYPLFLFCMVQGYRHTRSRKRYLLRLYLMSLFMTGFSYFLDSRFPTPNGYGNHNIFLPMLLTGVLISTIEWFGREDSFPVRAAMRTAHGINAARCTRPAYSVRSAVTGSLFAAFLDGISPPTSVKRTLRRISTAAGAAGSTALTSVVPAR